LKALPNRTFSLALGAAAGAIAVAILYLFPPDQHAFYPRCIFYRITGAQCPGCGGLRAVHHLLHGHLVNAWHYNAIVVLFLHIAGFAVLLYMIKPELVERGWQRFLSSGALWLVAIGAVIYGVLRNLNL